MIQSVSPYQAALQKLQPSQPGQITQAAQDFAAVMAQADSAAVGAMQGSTDAHVLVQSIAEAELALEAAVAIRDKVVEAYQEILRMPV